MGMIRRIFNTDQVRNYWITLPAAVLYALPFLRFRQYAAPAFRMSYLCLAMMGVVIFSSSAESSTFVIAVTGIGTWYVIQEKSRKNIANGLLLFVIIFTSLSATDLFPRYVREHLILPYSLKALPCFIVWCVVIFDLLLKDFTKPIVPKPDSQAIH